MTTVTECWRSMLALSISFVFFQLSLLCLLLFLLHRAGGVGVFQLHSIAACCLLLAVCCLLLALCCLLIAACCFLCFCCCCCLLLAVAGSGPPAPWLVGRLHAVGVWGCGDFKDSTSDLCQPSSLSVFRVPPTHPLDEENRD